jgi:excisionase family DNA binding protein
MKSTIKINADLQDILRDTLSYVQKTNEFIISLITALEKSSVSEKSTPPPVVVHQKPYKENMSVVEAADYCGYSKSYLYQLIHRKEIPFHKPTGGRIFFKRGELDEFISQGKNPACYEIRNKAAAILNGELG